ncbi:MAG: CBS domain-containing protein [Ignavibacterium sp.]
MLDIHPKVLYTFFRVLISQRSRHEEASMSGEYEDELSQMYEEPEHRKVLDSAMFQLPIKHLKVLKPVAVSPGAPVAEAVEVMRRKRIGCVMVTEKAKLVGILTERDILLKVAGVKGTEAKPVSEVMTPDPEVFQPDDSIAFVLNAMHVGGYRHVPVVDEAGKPVAVVSVKDIVGFILDHFAEDVLNLPPKPIRTTDQREGA